MDNTEKKEVSQEAEAKPAVPEQDKPKLKIKLDPKQVDMACEMGGKVADAADNVYENVKGKLGPSWGKAFALGIIGTFVVAMIHSPGLAWVTAIMVVIGAAPMIRKKVKPEPKDEKKDAKKE